MTASARGPSKYRPQPSDLLESGWVRLSADSSDNRRKRPSGNLGRCKSERGIKRGEPGRMQRHLVNQKPVAEALARRPLLAKPLYAAEQHGKLHSGGNGTRVAQPRP